MKSYALLSEVIHLAYTLRLLSGMHFQADLSRLKEFDLLMAIGGADSEEQDFAFTAEGEQDCVSDNCRSSTGHAREHGGSLSGS